jgi:light-regulated signal transduction histidine kinase (bacteriophytochrome)
VGIIRDNSERKRMEKELKDTLQQLEYSHEELKHFAYIASHDLKEPLRMVNSYLKLIEKKLAGNNLLQDGDFKEFMHFALDGSERMKKLLEDLLNYSRINSHKRPYQKIDIYKALLNVENNLRYKLQAKNVKIKKGALPMIYGDPVQITELFQNLIDNAVKFNHSKNPEIEIGYDLTQDYHCFFVKDNGIGIAEEFFDRIFIIFQKLHTNNEYSGSGIGLSICKKIVETHGGNIKLTSKIGEGSIFNINLPILFQD